MLSPQDAWLATMGQLQIQLHRATYETWVEGARFVSYESGVFTISVTNAYAKDWLEQRLYELVQRSLSTVFRQTIQVKFVVQAPAPKPSRFTLPDDDDEDFTPRTATLAAPPIEKAPAVRFSQGEHLNPDYTFDTFVVGEGNQLAHAAAQAVIQNPGKAYNPLFIHSSTGLGKTHLLHALGNAYQAQGLNVLYINAETFTNDLIRAIRTHQTEAFREHYRKVDVLLVDEVQFIAGKESTQEEFFHTFNALHNQGSQIILAGDRKPRNIQPLEERLRSRLEWGLTADLQAPDLDMRLEILQRKARVQDIDLPLPVAEFIASRVRTNVRELEGVMNRVVAQSALTRQPLTRAYLEAILRDEAAQNRTLSLQDILEATATFHQMTLDDLLGKERSKNVAMARHVAIYLAREESDATLPEIGRALGGRTHSTILNSYHKVVEKMASDPHFRREIAALRKQLKEMAS